MNHWYKGYEWRNLIVQAGLSFLFVFVVMLDQCRQLLAENVCFFANVQMTSLLVAPSGVFFFHLFKHSSLFYSTRTGVEPCTSRLWLTVGRITTPLRPPQLTTSLSTELVTQGAVVTTWSSHPHPHQVWRLKHFYPALPFLVRIPFFPKPQVDSNKKM